MRRISRTDAGILFALHEFSQRLSGNRLWQTDGIDRVPQNGYQYGAEQYLDVLHHHSNGIVQVYDLGGTYLHTLFFYCHGKGGFFLAADGQYVYVQDMRNNVYVLADGEFESFLEKADAEQQLCDIDFRSGASSANYEIRSDGIWRVEETGEQCIIESSANDRRTADSLFLLVCIAFAVIMLYQCRKRK